MKIMTFNDVVEEISKYKNNTSLHPNFLFRGQSNSLWSLEPSFTRIINKRKISREKSLQLENECITKFSISARNLLPLKNTISLIQRNRELDFYGWIAIMQHYSAPTRQLDWSISPWVALYFACNENEEFDANLYTADFKKVDDYSKKQMDKLNNGKTEKEKKNFIDGTRDPTSPEILVFITSLNTNERIETQQSRSSICTNPLTDHKKVLNDAGALNQINIPQNLKNEILQELNKMNINAKTLFPGIDGLGKSLYEYCKSWNINSIIE